jgi:acetyl esterase/lipase
MKLRLLLPLLFLSSLSLTTYGEEIRRISLDGKPGVPAPAQEDGKDGIARIKKIDQAALELFHTAKKPSHGTIMVSPGGGYGILAVTHEGRDVAKMLNDDGWDAAVLLYHVSEGPQTRDLALADAKAGLALLQKRGQEFGLSTQRVGAMGFSAGGHLTARLGHETANSNPPSFLVLMYPAYLEKDGKILDDVTPPKLPIFAYVAGDDKWAPSATVYSEACREAGVTCDFHKPEKGGHGFGLKNPLPESVRDWPAKLKAFLDGIAAK